jgi:hypothetical protein
MKLLNQLKFWWLTRNSEVFGSIPEPIEEIQQHESVYKLGMCTATEMSKSQLKLNHKLLELSNEARANYDKQKLIDAILDIPGMTETEIEEFKRGR